MKHIITTIIFSILIIALAKAQDTQDSTVSLSYEDVEIRKYYNIYQLSNRFNDPEVGRMALYEMLMISNNQPAILDSLAITYYSSGQYASSALVAQENLRIYEDNQLALEIAALSLQNLGARDQSLVMYEKLFLKNNETNTLYQMAFLQYELKKFMEASTSIELLFKRDNIDTIKLIFSKQDKTNQEVPMRAGILNLQGLLLNEQGKEDEAKKIFLEALQVSPGFEIAQLNLSQVGK